MDLGELQARMDAVYGARDRARGVPATVAWLAEELGELAQAVRKGDTADQLHELGDVLAWLASLAKQFDVRAVCTLGRCAPFACFRPLQKPFCGPPARAQA